MKYILVLVLTCCALVGFGQDSLNMERLAQWDPVGYPTNPGGVQYNDLWGWVAPTGEEYAILGNSDSILVIDVTECGDPQRVFGYYGGDDPTWRDFKTYGNYAYGVCDGCNEGLHIFDLGALPNGPVEHVLTTTEFFVDIHNIFIDEGSARLYAVYGSSGSTEVRILDLTDPESPTLLASHNLISGNGNHIHDLYVKNDTIYGSHGYEGFYVWDLVDAQNPILLGNVDTGNYNHSSWIDQSGQYAYYAEEVPTGQPMGIIDLTNLGVPNNDIFMVGTFVDQIEPNGSPTPHNPYVRGDYLYISYYEDGTKVYDISNPTSPVLLGYYDTYPSNDGNYTGYEGNWGTYPYLPSGCIISSDITFGLHTLQVDYGLTDTCTPVVDVDEANISSDTYIASNHLMSESLVDDGSTVTFQANFSVTLEPGFEVKAGADFEAKIDNCVSTN